MMKTLPRTILPLCSSGGLKSLVRGAGSSAHNLGVEGSVELLEGLLESAIARTGFAGVDRPVASTAQILLAGADLPEERSHNGSFRRRIQSRIFWLCKSEQAEWT